MSNTIKKTAVQASRRKLLQGAAGLAAMGLPAISLAQNKPIKIGMPTILSGRVAMLGLSSAILGLSLACLGPSWARLGPVLGLS